MTSFNKFSAISWRWNKYELTSLRFTPTQPQVVAGWEPITCCWKVKQMIPLTTLITIAPLHYKWRLNQCIVKWTYNIVSHPTAHPPLLHNKYLHKYRFFFLFNVFHISDKMLWNKNRIVMAWKNERCNALIINTKKSWTFLLKTRCYKLII